MNEPIGYNPWTLFKRSRQAKFITVEPVIFLYNFAAYMLYYLDQQYYFNQYALDKMNSTERLFVKENRSACINISNLDNYTGINGTYKEVEEEANSLTLYCSVLNRILSIMATLILGPLSDRFGRRMVIVYVAIGQILKGAVSICIILFDLNLYMFIVGSAIAGLFGDSPAILTASFAYVSDFTSKKTRTVRLGVAEASVFFASMISTGISGFWFAKMNCQLKYPIILFMICNILLLIYTLLYLPKSLTTEERKSKTRGKPKGIFALMAGFKIVLCQIPKYLSSVWKIWMALLAVFVMVIVMGTAYIAVYFFKALNWGPTLIGIYLSTSMAAHFISLLLILPLLTFLKFPDPLISLIAMLFNIFMNLFLGLSHQTYQVFIVAVLQGLDAMVIPPLRSYMSKLVSLDDQGALFSIMSALESVGSLMASVSLPKILPITLEHNMNPGTSNMVMAVVGLLALPFLGILLLSWCIEKAKSSSAIQMKDQKTPLLAEHTIQNEPIYPHGAKT